MDCEHLETAAFVDVARLTEGEGGPVTGYSASIRVHCIACAEAFVWVGLPVGLSPREAMVDVSGQELRAPLRPASAPPGFGEGGPGYRVQVGYPDA